MGRDGGDDDQSRDDVVLVLGPRALDSSLLATLAPLLARAILRRVHLVVVRALIHPGVMILLWAMHGSGMVEHWMRTGRCEHRSREKHARISHPRLSSSPICRARLHHASLSTMLQHLR